METADGGEGDVNEYSLTELFGRLEFAQPSLGVMLAAFGLVLLTVGSRIDRILIPATYVVIGLFMGIAGVDDPILKWLAGALSAVALGIASSHFRRVAVGVLGGAWSAVWFGHLAMSVGVPESAVTALAAACFAVAIALTFVMLSEATTAVLSFQGAALLVAGLIIVGSWQLEVWNNVRFIFLSYPLYLAFLLLSGTVIGYYLQMSEARRKAIGTSG